MTIHPHDHILRFRFTSDSRADVAHVVDLGEFQGFGECSCEDFTFRLLPALTRGEKPAFRCKHILAAREHLTDQLISRVSAS